MKSGDDSGKTYKGTVEIPNLSEEHTADEVDVTVSTSDKAASAEALKDFLRVKGVPKIREKLGQYIINLKQGKLLGNFRELNFFPYVLCRDCFCGYKAAEVTNAFADASAAEFYSYRLRQKYKIILNI